jgi:hypothetical protein
MKLLDKVKGMLKGKETKVKSGIDKVADVVDKKTGHKYTEKIEGATEKAKDAIDKLDDGDQKAPEA